ncbi:MAG TPA: glycoside hydrolase family 2 TIM barrel-domain containing protein [Galbitalea sp.]|nr:glycoside hydrolase family 2 TIM barrel-domain containing protein [Galbitalea sp.]
MARASQQDGTYPRPQLVREQWSSLDGEWDFAYDDADRGLPERWAERADGAFPLKITVPFVPESSASGIGDSTFHPIVWYRRSVSADMLPQGRRHILHFGAVDYSATVWVDGRLVATHLGGQVAFSVDITDSLEPGRDIHSLVVRARDDVDDPEVPRGKQDWQLEPHVVWYRRSTGIWRSVWVESVSAQHVASLEWTTDLTAASVTVMIVLALQPDDSTSIDIHLSLDGETLAQLTMTAGSVRSQVTIELPALRNAQSRDAYLWSPENPHLIDAAIVVRRDGRAVDEVASYLGVRSTTVGAGAFRLNGIPYFVRSVLEQGWWDESHLTAPSPAHYRAEVEAIRELGFNAARIHQKTEDPRMLYWADRLGLLIWAESASAYAFSPRAVRLMITEWQEIVTQYCNHPSIVTWVPVNESWGVQDIAGSLPQREFVQALASLTRALDPSRPVVSNDGWEHVDSDLMTLHDYASDPELIRRRYADLGSVAAVLRGHGPQLRSPALSERQLERFDLGLAPLMITEFGGISFAGADSWGYSVVTSDAEFTGALGDLFAAVLSSPVIAGFCYTQFTDTLQESNGLLGSDRSPKLPVETLRAMIMGVSEHNRLTGAG